MSYITINAQDVGTGEVVEAIINNSDVRIGDEFEENGRKLRRLPNTFATRIKDKPFLAHGLPHEDAVEGTGFTRAPHYVNGVPAFTSKAERSEYMAKHNDNPAHGDQIVWDQ